MTLASSLHNSSPQFLAKFEAIPNKKLFQQRCEAQWLWYKLQFISKESLCERRTQTYQGWEDSCPPALLVTVYLSANMQAI